MSFQEGDRHHVRATSDGSKLVQRVGFFISVSKDGSSLSPAVEASQVLTPLLPPGFCLLLQLLRIIGLALDSVVDLNQWGGAGPY